MEKLDAAALGDEVTARVFGPTDWRDELRLKLWADKLDAAALGDVVSARKLELIATAVLDLEVIGLPAKVLAAPTAMGMGGRFKGAASACVSVKLSEAISFTTQHRSNP